MKKKEIFLKKSISIIDIQKQGAISIAQLKHSPQNSLEYISIHQAFRNNYIKIEEISDSGSVNELILTNLSKKYIFLMDGDILKGAKQNRVVNTSVLVKPNTKIFIPVSCVEQGRWGYNSKYFSPSEELIHGNIRSQKTRNIYNNPSMGSSKYRTNQSEVWNNVSYSMNRLNVRSKTACYSENYVQRRSDFKKKISSFSIERESNGIAYFIHGYFIGMEIFNRKDIFQDYFEKIILSISMYLEINNHLFKNNQSLSESTMKKEIEKCIEGFNEKVNSVDSCEGVCLGKEYRLVTNEKVYYSLSYQEQIIHQFILAREILYNEKEKRNFSGSFFERMIKGIKKW